MIRYLIIFAIIGLQFNDCFGKITPSTKSTASTKSTSTSTSKSTSTTKTTTSTTSTSTTTTSVPHSTLKTDEWIDPAIGGKYGNPGAMIYVTNKSMDSVHTYASDVITRAIRDMVMTDFAVQMPTGVLTIKAPHVTEASFGNVNYQYMPSNKILTCFSNGKFVANGEWQWLVNKADMNGTYTATVTNAELKPVTQIGRAYNAKPSAQVVQCSADLSQFHISINGAGSELTSVQNCSNHVCNKIRQFFESTICELAKKFVQDVINPELAKYPARMSMCSQYQIDYGLQWNEPKVTDDHVQAGLEGKVLYRGYGSVSFYPQDLTWVSNNDRSGSLLLSDYTINTLFQQTHSAGYQYSAVDLLSSSTKTQDLLKLNCSTPTVVTRRTKNLRISHMGLRATISNCLGSILENVTNTQYSTNDTGDLIFKSYRKAPTVAILSSQHGYFDASNGVLELYGPQSSINGKRQLLTKVDVQLMRGNFTPKLNSTNITGSIDITSLTLAQSQPSRALIDLSLEKLAQFAMPILTDMFNAFLQQVAQFPVPLPDGYECSSPQLKISTHTIQLDCDVKCPQQTRMNCRCKWGRCSCGQ